MIIIGIAGGTGSGKTTVVKSIVDSLSADEVALLPLDSYYNDSSHVPVELRQVLISIIRMLSTGSCCRSMWLCFAEEKR